jgi:hypothetical protein
MVSRGVRGHTAPGRCIVKRKNGICRAARFERANLLKIFALKEEGGSAGLIQSRTRQHKRSMNMWSNPLMG